MALDEWTPVDLTLQALTAPAAVGMHRIIKWVRADAREVGLLLARLGSYARSRGGKTDNLLNLWACWYRFMRPHEIFCPGANSKDYQPEAIGARYHMRWGRVLLWRSLDRYESALFDEAATATDKARNADYLCGEGASRNAGAARAEILAEKYRCTQGDDPKGELFKEIEKAFHELRVEAEAAEGSRRTMLYEALGYDWTRVIGIKPDGIAREEARRCYQLANEPSRDQRRDTIIDQLQKQHPENGRYIPSIPGRANKWWHRHLPGTSYFVLGSLIGIVIVLAGLWPWFVALAGRYLGLRLGLGVLLVLLGAVWLMTGIWMLKVAFTEWDCEINVGASDLSHHQTRP